MSTSNGRRAERIAGLVRGYCAAVDALAASDDPESQELAARAFTADAVSDALGEALSTRAPFRALASPPAFQGKGRRVAGSLWHRSVGWHAGSGNLWGLHSVLWDARSVARRPEGRGLPASWLAEIERSSVFGHAIGNALVDAAVGDGFLDALETTTTIYRLVHHGRSRAVDAWQAVLGERVPA